MFRFILLLLFPVVCLSQDVINIHGIDCNLHGSSLLNSKTYYLNALKNRYQFPLPDNFDENISFQDLMESADPNQFSENKSLRLTGFVFNVKTGGVETCNCKSKDPEFRDTHIELTPDENHTDPQYRIIAEVTPRIRELMAAKGIDWSTRSLRQILKGRKVQIAGWLFYDSEHENASFANDPEDQGGPINWRASCWEIHPVTEIEILDSDVILTNPGKIAKKPANNNAEQSRKTEVHNTTPQPGSIHSEGNDNFKYILVLLVILILVIVILIYNKTKH